MEQVRLVLEKEPFNIHALCNAALFYHQMGEAEGLQQIITLLRKMRPIVPEHMYKLAMTMGILGEDETAYQLFGKLNDRLMVNDPVVVHYTALAAFHTERIQQAERLWKQLQKIDPVSKVADYFLDQLTLYKQNKIGLARYPYYYQLHEDPVKPVDLAELINGHQNDPSLRSTLFWALKFSDATAKNRVIQAMGLIGDSEVEETLRAFLLESSESKESKLMALFILQYMNARAPFEIMIGKRRRSLSASQAMNTLPEWMGSWLEVLSILRRNISGDDTGIYWLEARSIWLKCLMQCYPHLPTLRKTEGWAAALEYWIFKKNHLQVSQMEVARKYHVSASTVSKRIKELRQTIEEHFNG
jgi:tetratricopeptide (TPR) repeat protein